jgi:hypothetical protein
MRAYLTTLSIAMILAMFAMTGGASAQVGLQLATAPSNYQLLKQPEATSLLAHSTIRFFTMGGEDLCQRFYPDQQDSHYGAQTRYGRDCFTSGDNQISYGNWHFEGDLVVVTWNASGEVGRFRLGRTPNGTYLKVFEDGKTIPLTIIGRR